MAEINQNEMQKIKDIIKTNEVSFQKLNTYSSQAVDPQIKQLFIKFAQEKLNEKQKILDFLEQ